MANGFEPHAAGAPLKIIGANRSLHEHWAKYGEGGMIAYRSALNAGFPNMGQINAANTGTGNQSLIFASECTVNFLLEVAKPVLAAARPPQLAIEHMPAPGRRARCSGPRSPRSRSSSRPNWTNSTLSPKPCPARLHSGCKVRYLPYTDQLKLMTEEPSLTFFLRLCRQQSWYIDPKSGRVYVDAARLAGQVHAAFALPQVGGLYFTGLKNGSYHPSGVPFWKLLGNKLGLGHVPYVDPKETPQINRKAMDA